MPPPTAGVRRASYPSGGQRRDAANDPPGAAPGPLGTTAGTTARPDGERWTPLAGPSRSGAAGDAGAVSVSAPPDPRPLDRVAAGLPRPRRRPRPPAADEDGSLVTEYGLLAILGATAVSLVLKFLSGGALFELFGAVLGRVRALVGA